MTYREMLMDPRWQKKRLEVLQSKGFKCEECDREDMTLHVHHRYYISGRFPWEYPDFCYQVLCYEHHEELRKVQEDQRAYKGIQFEDWEVGLNHFGNLIVCVAHDDAERKWLSQTSVTRV